MYRMWNPSYVCFKVDWHTFSPASFQLALITRDELNEYQRKSGANKLELLEELWDNEELDLEYRDFDRG